MLTRRPPPPTMRDDVFLPIPAYLPPRENVMRFLDFSVLIVTGSSKRDFLPS